METYKFVTKWGKFGALDGEFNLPTDVAIDHNDDVFVADSWNHRIQKFSKRGTFKTKWGQIGQGNGDFYNPWSVITDLNNHEVYVGEYSN
ncbi:MAG: 6-bladed beta-propeller, partial [Thaumarchaeota archaeon]